MNDLFEGFETASLEAWKKQMEKDLKGLTFEQLSFTDDNGLRVAPFYNHENSPAVKNPVSVKKDWNICAMAGGLNEKLANAVALEELNGGADSLLFFVNERTDFAALFKGVSMPHIRSWFSLSATPSPAADALLTHFKQQKIELSSIQGAFIYDPVMAFARGYQMNIEEGMNTWQSFAAHTFFKESAYTPFVADCWQYTNAGANTVTELACILAHVNEYLNLIQHNKDLLKGKQLCVIVSSDVQFFESLSKFRAVRMLLSFLLKQYGMDNEIFIHAATPMYNKTVRDPYNNMLRTCIESMSAVLGGADSCYVFPFDSTYALSDENSRRWARNQQLILKEESFLNKVADSAAGSWYIEQRTADLAEAAWQQFKEIEKAGGLIVSLKSGAIQKKIADQAEEKSKAYAEGRKILAGVNKFRNEKEEVKNRIFNVPENKNFVGFVFPENKIEEEKKKQAV